MMNWRLHLSSQPVKSVQIVPGAPALVVAWLAPGRGQCFDLSTGALYDSLSIVPPPDLSLESETWQSFLAALRAPNGAFLPVVDLGHTAILTSYDGRLRVYWVHGERLVLDVDGRQTALFQPGGAPLVAVALDRELGTIAALSADAELRFYQQCVYIGAYPVGRDGSRPVVLLPDAADAAILVDETGFRVVDMAGHVVCSQASTSRNGTAACSPGGTWLVLGEQGTLRAYDADLRLVRQGNAWNLLAHSTPLQLFGGLPPSDAAVQGAAVADDGTLIVAMAGMICRAQISDLSPLPQPRTLF